MYVITRIDYILFVVKVRVNKIYLVYICDAAADLCNGTKNYFDSWYYIIRKIY